MEATGVYWAPVWQVLDADTRTLILANAAHVKNVPGRKTDVADAVWLCDLLAHGLIRASFVPEARRRRCVTCCAPQAVGPRAGQPRPAHPEGRSRKPISSSPRCSPTSWACPAAQSSTRWSGRDVRSGRAAGPGQPTGEGRAEAIRAALTGRIDDHHRFLLGVHLRQYDGLKAAIAEVDAQVERDLGPFREAVELLATIPGVSDLTAQVILSEIGLDMDRFPTAGHMISGRAVPEERRERGKAPLDTAAQGRPLAQDGSGPGGLGGVRKKRSAIQAQFQRLRAGAGRRRPSAPWPPPCSRRSTTCSRRHGLCRSRVLITSTRPRQPPEPRRSRDKSSASDLHAKSKP